MELWDLYTADRQPTGRTHIRGQRLPDDLYHIAVHVWLMNSHGQFLISQRDASRPTFPLQWECVGGSVLAGETSLQGALREVKEEIGVTLSADDGRLLESRLRGEVNGVRINDIKDVWLFPYEGEADLAAATEKEVADARWMTVAEIRALHEAGRLVASLDYFFTVVAPLADMLP